MCQILVILGARDAAMRKNIEVPALKETRAVYMNNHCEHGHLPY